MNESKKKLEKNSFLLAFSIFLIDFFKNMGILAKKPLYIAIIYIAIKLEAQEVLASPMKVKKREKKSKFFSFCYFFDRFL